MQLILSCINFTIQWMDIFRLILSQETSAIWWQMKIFWLSIIKRQLYGDALWNELIVCWIEKCSIMVRQSISSLAKNFHFSRFAGEGNGITMCNLWPGVNGSFNESESWWQLSSTPPLRFHSAPVAYKRRFDTHKHIKNHFFSNCLPLMKYWASTNGTKWKEIPNHGIFFREYVCCLDVIQNCMVF